VPDGIDTAIVAGEHPPNLMQSQMIALVGVELADPDVLIPD
jgi:hypothetical protein